MSGVILARPARTGGGSSAGFTELAITSGSIDGLNQDFGFDQEPSYIVSDGTWLKALDGLGGTNWSWSAGVATLTSPPSHTIYGVA